MEAGLQRKLRDMFALFESGLRELAWANQEAERDTHVTSDTHENTMNVDWSPGLKVAGLRL